MADLPFLKNRRPTTIIMNAKEPAGDEGLHSAAEDLIAAVHAKDVSRVASALEAAFQMLDSAPEEEFGDNDDFLSGSNV